MMKTPRQIVAEIPRHTFIADALNRAADTVEIMASQEADITQRHMFLARAERYRAESYAIISMGDG